MWNCHKCGKPVFFAERKQSLGYDWHPECLRCEECGKRLDPGLHAEHKGVPYCNVPCYGALFGPQLFGHGTRVESHKSFGIKGSCRPSGSPALPRDHLESKLKVYNQFFNNKSHEIRSREVNDRLVLEGALRVYWGVQGIIHLKEDDDQRTVITVRKRNSCRYVSSSEMDSENSPFMYDKENLDGNDTGIDISTSSLLDGDATDISLTESLSYDTASISSDLPSPGSSSSSKEVSPEHKSLTLPSKLDVKQLEWDDIDELLQVKQYDETAQARKVDGRFLVVVPLSTLINWQNEFEKWCPSLRVLRVHGNGLQRQSLMHQLKTKPYDWDVCLTTYETCKAKFTRRSFASFHWHHIILDEGHRIKNDQSQLGHTINLLKSSYRIILTGTPLNNNLHELWVLLSFLMPNLFNDGDDFDDWFDERVCLTNDRNVVDNLHLLLKPLLLRRLKSEVERDIKPKKEIMLYVDITDRQREWYKKVLQKDIGIITGDGKFQWTRLNAMFMQLRKCTNHPYLFPGAEDGPPFENGEHIVSNSGKMILLDRLVTKLLEQKSKILIFSQMTRMLDIIEDLFYLRDYEYCRLDGNTNVEDRVKAINEFQKADSKKSIFLLSTRAGGLGINLTAADSVIIYDADWNPQIDLQAISRAHRIGQTKEVRVFRLVTRNTVDQKIIERANWKLKLDNIVIQSQVETRNCTFVKQDFMAMVRFGADSILSNDTDYNGAERDKLILENVQKMIDQLFEVA